MQQGFDRGVSVGIILLAAMMVGIAVTSHVNTRILRNESARATQSHEFLDAINVIRIDTRKLQATQRAYLVTGFREWIKPYEEAASVLRADAEHLLTLTANDPEQFSRATEARREIESGIHSLDAVVKLRGEPNGHNAVVELSRERGSRSFVDPLLETLLEMDRAERQRLADREAEARAAYDRTILFGISSMLLGLVAIGLFVRVLRRSHRARARDAARIADQRELLNATLTSIGDGVIATDSEGNVTFLNGVAETLTGWKSADAVGVPLDVVFHLINESSRLPVENPAHRSLKEGAIVGLANHTILVARDGTEHSIDDSAAPIRSGGKVSGAVLVFRDITDRRRAETEKQRLLLEVEAERLRLAEVFQHAPSFTCVTRGTTHIFERANDRFIELVGRRDILGQTVRATFPEVEGQGFFEILDRVYFSGDPYVGTDARIMLQRKGILEARIVDFVFQPLREAEGSVAGLIVQGIDITERRRAEQDLSRVTAESERQRRMFETALSNTPDFIYLFDLEGRFTYINKALLDLWQIDLAQALGKDFTELQYPPDLAERLQNQIRAVIQTRQPIRDETLYTSVKGTRAYEYILVPVLGESGEVEAVAGSTRDITERKQAEASLAASEERYRVLVTANADVVFQMNSDWSEMLPLDGRNLVASNPEPIRNWMQANLPHFEHDRVREAIQLAISTRQTLELEHQIIRADDSLGWTLSRAAPILDATGNIVEWFGTARDVTERKEMEAALRETDRKKDDFIALLAHELRNPLAPIRNGLQVIRLSADKDSINAVQAMMDRQLSHMVRMIDDLLDVSRIGRNKMVLRRGRVSVVDILTSAIETARPAIDDAGHQLTISFPPHPVYLEGDLTRLSQVFSNLLTNSAKYTELGGQIWLSAEYGDAAVIIAVRDNGTGIPAESLPKIFDMFSQIDRSIEKATGGLGIGLSLVKGLVEMHGGTVMAQSEGQGRGSTFTVTLPIATSEPIAEPVPTVNVTSHHPRRILVVDDNRDGAESLTMMLELIGHTVKTAYDGLEAIQIADIFRPELILMDVGMPKLNGLEATKRIREQPWGTDITILALTGWGQEKDRERSRDAGCNGHLVKPVDLTELQRLLIDLGQGKVTQTRNSTE